MNIMLMGRGKRKNVYAPGGWDTVWQAAKAASGTTPANIAFIGDSTMQGSTTTDYFSKSWPSLLRASLVGTYGLYSDYYSISYSVDAVAGITGTPPWTVNVGGATRTWTIWGLGAAAWFAGGTPTEVYVSPYACTEMALYHLENWAGTYQIAVDGANAGSTAAAVGAGSIAQSYSSGVLTITVTNTANVGLTRKITVTGLDNAVHTVTGSTQSANYVMIMQGAASISGATGIGFGFAAYSGRSAYLFFDPASTPSWSGKTVGTTYNMGFPSQGHLAVIQLGINDCAQSRTLAQFRADLERGIDGLRVGRANMSIMLVVSSNPGEGSDIVASRFPNYANWPGFVDVMYAVAKSKNCALVNIHDRWGLTSYGKGFAAANNNAHPSDAGAADIYSVIAPMV